MKSIKRLALLLLALVGVTQTLFAQTLKVGIQSIPSTQTLAIASGILEEELKQAGIKLEVFSFDTGRDINNAFASKSIDVGFLGTTPYVAGILGGLETDVIHISFVSKQNEGLAVKKNGGIKSVGDIKGKKIGVPFGTSAHYALLSTLKVNNIAQNEVKLLDLNPTDLFAAWQRGDIDAAFVWDTYLSDLENANIIYSDEDLLNVGIILSDVSAVRKEYKDEKALKAYIRALDRAYDLYINNRKEAVEVFAKHFKFNPEIVEGLIDEKKALWLDSKALKEAKFLGTPTQKGEYYKTIQGVAEFLHTQGVLRKIPKSIKFDSYINPSFLQ
ncbi:MetQ/NlpA family ABC transporter substrate-binding protein [Helicobacter turcicus]|uniref:ABC transporter substrate-binding protein n=1 Tax=Helicobacter turcicus TaxID=2867412 RepID=A0ABS7JNN0_9HELI|nr:MetQ/NlpA family ABC transporter substrate-binding protein [Helicobacter turcicus]MBX7490988.1 ABC transporter substrate-binding protein [Helicobacter turcicus]MBX7545885.1 ABC transporter substrate-binding protein [Helicobacter turcicus]